MAKTIKILLLLIAVVSFGGCSNMQENALWSIPTDTETILVTQAGKTVWHGNGDAVENQWGNVLVTDWQTGEPMQTLFDQTGKILLQTQPNEQIMQLSEKLFAVQNAQQQWRLTTPKGRQYLFERADLQQNGDVLLCGVDGNKSVRLDSEGKELQTFSQKILWTASGLENWYQTPDGKLIDLNGNVVYENVERMVGDGNVLIKQGDSYCVFDVKKEQKIYCGTKNWCLYLKNLQIEQLDTGFQGFSGQKRYVADTFTSYELEDKIFCYSLKNQEQQIFWNSNGEKMFECIPFEWVQPIQQDLIAAISKQNLQMLSQQGEILWQKNGYSSAWTAQTEQGVVICAVKDSGKTDVFSQQGICLFEDVEQVSQVSKHGIVFLKEDKTSVFNWTEDCYIKSNAFTGTEN